MIANHWTRVATTICCVWMLNGCGADEPVDQVSSEQNPTESASDAGDGASKPSNGGAGAAPTGTGTASGGAPASGSTNMSSPENALVGDYCDSDAPCAEGLECLQESSVFFGAGTLPGGFCSAKCESGEAGDNSCAALDQRSVCLTFTNGTPEDESDDQGYCIDLCLVGTNADGDTPDCDLRLDRYCEPLDPQGDSNIGACLPRCFGDASCPGGFCDGVTGACVAEAPPGKSRGEVCAGGEECSGGICYLSAPDAETGVCTEACILAPAAGACGEAPDGDEPPKSLCWPSINTLVNQTPIAVGDLGVCTGTCDSDADCGHDGFLCSQLSDEITTELGRKGICLQTFAFEDPSGAGGAGQGGSGGTEQGGSGGTERGGAGGTGAGGTGAGGTERGGTEQSGAGGTERGGAEQSGAGGTAQGGTAQGGTAG